MQPLNIRAAMQRHSTDRNSSRIESEPMEIQLLRHATLVVQIGTARMLVDPMLSPAEALDPIPNAPNAQRFPMVELPLTDDALRTMLDQIDAVLVTHTHRDHWDARAIELLRKDIPVFCQPTDTETITSAGFTTVQPIATSSVWNTIEITRTGGQHGTGAIGKRMGVVSGFVLRAPDEPALYIAGDTIWCDEVSQALHTFQPDVAVLNAGAAQFLVGGPITMDAADVIAVCHAAPHAQIVAVHMETVPHCLLTRDELRAQLARADVANRVTIPADGALHTFHAGNA